VAKAQQKALGPSGINLLQANGPGAGQTVFHLHFHVLPRTAQDGELKVNWGHNPGDMAKIKATYEKMLAAM
jgi:histidine triad (HIT) family protein